MIKKLFFISMFMMLTFSTTNAYDLATEISHSNGKVTLSSIGYAKLGIIKINTASKGMITLHGTIAVKGKVNVVMWSKVEGKYYFSKIPVLQNMYNQKNVNFEIPFNAAEKIVTEVILEVELIRGGTIMVDNIELING